MMDPMDNSNSQRSTTRPYRDNDLGQQDEENVMYPPEQEVELTSSRTYRNSTVYSVVGLATITVIGLIVLFSQPSGDNKRQDSAPISLADNPDSSNTNLTVGFGPIDDEEDTTGLELSFPMTTPMATLASPSPSPNKPEEDNTDKDTASVQLGCLSDRFDNDNMPANNRLLPGQYICSRNDARYQFGVTTSGDIVLKDTQENSTDVVYENPHKLKRSKNKLPLGTNDMYLSLHKNGFLVMNKVDASGVMPDEAVWKATPQMKMHLTENCLPEHDCPYFHMHQGGVLVVNWVSKFDEDQDGSKDWMAKNFRKIYDY